MGKVLVVDDEPSVLSGFEEMLNSMGHEVMTASRADEALRKLPDDMPEVVVMDICMPGMNGLDAIRSLRQLYPKLPVIIMTGQGTMESAIEATKLGAFDYQLKPFDPEEMIVTIERAFEGVRLSQRQVDLNPGAAVPSRDAIVGQCAAMQQVYKAIGRVAATDATVLIRGESGTGKELVARAIYQHSLRSNAPMLVVNCVAIPETLLESELFGYERGAFTGATTRRIGKFEQAHGGTIFLDEIGDLPLGVQAKILRVLQERSFERIGGNETIRVDVRVLAATNRNLEEAIAEGSFREDLYHRLNVVTVRLPPLRDRKEDLQRLTNYFVERFARELGIEKPAMSDEARALVANYGWPGNVRELVHCIYRAMIFTRGYPIQAVDLQRAMEQPSTPNAAAAAPVTTPSTESRLQELIETYLDNHGGQGTYEHFLEKVDQMVLEEALRRTRGNQTHAAKLLGLPRPTLHAKMRKYEINTSDE